MWVLCAVGVNKFDAAGHTYALETPLLISVDVITADVELGQRPCPHVLDGRCDSNRA
jgi:hypothetical protein